MSKLTGLVELVQVAIDKGATSVEEVHLAVANEPLEILKTIAPLEATATGIQEIQNQTIGSVYETIRVVNREVTRIATGMLEEAEKAVGEPDKD